MRAGPLTGVCASECLQRAVVEVVFQLERGDGFGDAVVVAAAGVGNGMEVDGRLVRRAPVVDQLLDEVDERSNVLRRRCIHEIVHAVQYIKPAADCPGC